MVQSFIGFGDPKHHIWKPNWSCKYSTKLIPRGKIFAVDALQLSFKLFCTCRDKGGYIYGLVLWIIFLIELFSSDLKSNYNNKYKMIKVKLVIMKVII